MHYKNGREAHEYDSVIAPSMDGKSYLAGMIYNLNTDCTSCNGRLATIIPGGIEQAYVTIGNCIHIEDAYNNVPIHTVEHINL